MATTLRAALGDLPIVGIEHVGSTSVPGLAAKPVIDIDVIVSRAQLQPAIDALVTAGYTHRGDLGGRDRESLAAPDADPARNVYVCVENTSICETTWPSGASCATAPICATAMAR